MRKSEMNEKERAEYKEFREARKANRKSNNELCKIEDKQEKVNRKSK